MKHLKIFESFVLEMTQDEYENNIITVYQR